MNAASKVEADKLALWNALSKTDPAHTKAFQRAGGFKGTAIKPIWIVKMLTEQFGPCGEGWGMDKPEFQVVNGDNREVMVFCTVSGWYLDAGGERCTVYGVGGDKVVTYIKANEQYKRPERWENDDEAFKKAFTDAVNNAFKFVGVGADVHMGLFDDSKYLAEVRAEFEAKDEPPPAKIPGISKIKARLNTLMQYGNGATALDEFNSLVREYADDLTKIKEGAHPYWTGDGEDFEGFKAWIVRRRAELAEPQEDGQYKMLIDSMKTCTSAQELVDWTATNAPLIEELDGEESRSFQLAYDLYASGLKAVATVAAG